MARLNLSPPWDNYYRLVNALFGKDPDIRVVYDEAQYLIKLYVEDGNKAEAISRILPGQVDFGSVMVETSVIPGNESEGLEGMDGAEAFELAFCGSPIVSYIHSVEGVFANPLVYIVFKPEIAQFFTDNLGDIHGFCSILYQDAAEKVFPDHSGVFFCTDLIHEGKPLGAACGDWP